MARPTAPWLLVVALAWDLSLWWPTPLRAGQEVVGSGRAFTAEIVILRGAKVRLSGLAGPPAGKTCPGSSGPRDCAEAAKAALQALLAGATVTCALEAKVGHGSYKGSCRRADGLDLGAAMVEAGWLRAAD